MSKCSCKVCVYGIQVQKQLNAISDKAARDFFEEMYWRLQHVETDLNVIEAMRDGSWPSGKLVFVPNG